MRCLISTALACCLVAASACGGKGKSPSGPDTTGTDTGAAQDLDHDGFTDIQGDCDDRDPATHPTARERCDGVDNNCDGLPHPSEVDSDGDGILDCDTCDEAGFWPTADDIDSSAALDSALADWLPSSGCRDYAQARTFLFLVLDNRDGEVQGIYTGETFTIGSATPDWNEVNTEHVWPRSDGADRLPQECDLNHLFIADAEANTRRGNTPFGAIATSPSWEEGGSALGEDSAGAPVFEPRPEVKGDIARALMYFASRYETELDLDTQLNQDRLATFKQWHLADPPTRMEQLRSLRIRDEQGTANPFVVCPAIADWFEL